jgi:SNF2 family DNA or RNA helicase
MLVIPEKRRIVINSDKTDDVLAVIPHARKINHNGESLLAMPYGVDESLVLRNMGFQVPPPIQHFYDWPGRFQPMGHQRDTAAFLTTHKRAICLNSPGTGKTISTLWAADFLLNEGVVDKVLIVAPLSTLKPVWARELRHHLPHRSFVVCTGPRKKREELLDTPGVQFVIINHDGFTNMASKLAGFGVVVYDEATALKTPGALRYRAFHKWVTTWKPWLWMLTGTPISQSPVDAWTLARLLESPVVPRSFTTFKDKVMEKVSTFRFIPRPSALEVCRQVLQPSIRFSLDECVDIPQTNFVGRKTELTPQQDLMFRDMKTHALAVLGGSQVTAPNAAVVLTKLMQICTGVVISDTGLVALDSAPRYNSLTELLDEIGDKAIIFVPFKGVQKLLLDKLKADGYSVALVNGDTSKTERDKIFNDFQYTDEPKILLAHPRVAAHGLTLTRSKDVIWYAPIFSLEQYEQANARIRRLNTEGKTNVWHIWATPFEAELYRRLRTKQNTLTKFLDLVNGINSD